MAIGQKRIAIFGLGYVGCVCAACLSHQGHRVIGVDSAAEKVEQISSGKPTVIEPGLADLLAAGHAKELLSATEDCERAVLNADIGFICVGTPGQANGHLELGSVYAVADSIGSALAKRSAFFTVVIRSTVLPGTNGRVAEILETASGKRNGVDFGVVSNPEFLREGSAIGDYLHPQISVIGSSCERAMREIAELYSSLETDVKIVSVETAEIIKYVSNTFHALKVTFANEIGAICKRIGVDSHEVMRLFCEDKRLNISSAYLTPGSPYGGSCLPKDLRGLLAIAQDSYAETPVMSGIEKSNAAYKECILQAILQAGKKRIGFIGLSFKAGTDDLRSSPAVELIERLVGKGHWVLVYDRNVQLAKLIGANKTEIEKRIPKIRDFMTDSLDMLLQETDIVVILQKEPGIRDLIRLHPDKLFMDLVRIDPELRSGGNYAGIAW